MRRAGSLARVLAVVFALAGGVTASFAARIPALQDRLGLSHGELGLAFLALEAGAVLGLPGGGALVARLGSRRSLRLGFGVCPPALAGLALAPGLPALALALGVMAAATSVVDVAMNTQGVEVERRTGATVMSRLHAAHSLGVLAGGLGGTAAAAAGVPVAAHLTAAAAIVALAGQTATSRLVGERTSPGPVLARPRGRLLGLGLLAFCAFLVEGAASNWSAVHLRAAHDASGGLAAAAFTAFALALAAGRLAGDRLIAGGAVRAVRAVRAAGLVAASGLTLGLAAPNAGVALAGWAVLGGGIAIVAPAAMRAAGAEPGTPAPVAIAAVTTVGYLGSFTAPPLIGALAELASLSAALGLVVLAAVAVAAFARNIAAP